MSKLAEKVQQDLVEAIDNDDLVLPTLPEVALQIRRAAEDPGPGDHQAGSGDEHCRQQCDRT